MTTDVTPEATQNFQEVLSYCRQVLGGHTRLASQRELSEALSVAPTMAGRYISGETDFYNLRSVTVELLARACQLDVGTVFIWVAKGRKAAMEHEELLRQEPVAFSPLDHCRRAVQLLELQEAESRGAAPPAPPLPVDFSGLRLALEMRRGQDGSPMSSLFDTLVRSIAADETLARVEQQQELGAEDWFRLQQLLGVAEAELLRLYGPERTAARTDLPPA